VGGILWDILFLVSVSVFVVGAVLKGYIPTGLAIYVLLAFLLFRVLGRAMGGGMNRAIRWAFHVGLPLASLAMFAVTFGNGDPRQVTAVLTGMGSLVLVLFGLYVMLRGPFTRGR
jgi:hypothetical protein